MSDEPPEGGRDLPWDYPSTPEKAGRAAESARAPANAPLPSPPPRPADAAPDEARGDPEDADLPAAATPRKGLLRELDSATQDCVIVGPSKAGKTNLILAVSRACQVPAEDAVGIEFIPERGGGTAALLRSGIQQIITREKRMGTSGPGTDYPFSLEVTPPPGLFGRKKTIGVRMTMSDAPGGGLFPNPTDTDKANQDPDLRSFRQRLFPRARRASSIVLCVSADDPRPDILYMHMPGLIAQMCVDVEGEHGPLAAAGRRFVTLVRPGRLPDTRGELRRRLNFDRFLVLFTRVDQYCYKALDQHRADHPGLELKAEQAAHRVDPVRLACDLVGPAFLNMILQALRPNATLAVGLSSAFGFDPAGDPFADEGGYLRNMGANNHADMLRLWTPFGVREALYFIATGEATGPVAVVNRSHLLGKPSEAQDLTRHFCPECAARDGGPS